MITQERMQEWFTRGQQEGASHMIIVCDTFDWTDFPVYVQPDQQVRNRIGEWEEEKKSMHKVMEVYNLALPFEAQYRQRTAWNL